MLDWLQSHGLAIAFWAIVLFVAYRYSRPLIHRLLMGLMRAQEADLVSDEAQRHELEKRVKTLERAIARRAQLVGL